MKELLHPLFKSFLKLNEIDVEEYSFNEATRKRYVRFKVDAANENLEKLVLQFEKEVCCKLEKVNWFPEFYCLDSLVKIAHSSMLKSGLVYGMDIASGIACHALQIEPNDQILDLCCAPGAKLCYLFDLLGAKGDGTVTGTDISKNRLFTARSIIQKYHLNRCRLFLTDGTKFDVPPPNRIGSKIIRENEQEKAAINGPPNHFLKPFFANRLIRNDSQLVKGFYDKVLVDAECTHDGSIAHIQKYIEKDWLGFESEFLSQPRLSTLHDLQFNLLSNGFKLLKPGGLLVYSTCSFSRKQNEDIVVKFLNLQSDKAELCLIPTMIPNVTFPVSNIDFKDSSYPSELYEKTMRFSPRKSGTSGLFIALIRKLA